jgi:hypothetical protein
VVSAARAGLRYAALVFAAGFVLGTLRVLALEPAFGPVAAVAAEVPAMLALAWLACGAVLRRVPVASQVAPRLAMGAVAFAALIAAEVALGLALGRGPAEMLAGLARPEGAIGLAGQVAFALVPVLRLRRGQGMRSMTRASR